MLVKQDMPLALEIDALGRKGRARKLAAPSEAMVQRAIIQMCQFNGIMAVHCPNEAKRSMIGHMRAKMDGLRRGFPDLMLYAPGARHGLMEVKAPGWKAPLPPKAGAKPSAAYSEWADRLALYDRLRGFGFPVAVVQSVDDARLMLREWGWLR